MQFSDLVRGRRVAIFLHMDRDLIGAIKRADAHGIALYLRPCEIAPMQDVISRTYRGETDIEENNAEVLFLGGSTAQALRQRDFRLIGHARFVLLPIGLHAAKLIFSMQRHLARKRLKFIGSFSLGGLPLWLAFENTHSGFAPSSRYYFSTTRGAREFFSDLCDFDYCVFDGGHPECAGEDTVLKLLVHNKHVDAFTRRVTADLGFSPVEIYSPFSEPGHCLKSHISYFPPERALEMLVRRREDENGIPRASAYDRLLGYCYHLLFHQKDLALGPKGEILPSTWNDESVYTKLIKYCDDADVRRFGTVGEMEALLRRERWFPSTETMAFIARKNRFVQRRHTSFLHLKPGLAVFVVRQLAADHGLIDEIEKMIASAGFEILKSGSIPDDLRDLVTARFRGGNWALPVGAGPPIHYMVAFDRNPKKVTPKLFVDALATDNGRLFAKQEIRKKAAALAGTSSFNALHSSDNSCAALEYIEILAPELYAECAALVQSKN